MRVSPSATFGGRIARKASRYSSLCTNANGVCDLWRSNWTEMRGRGPGGVSPASGSTSGDYRVGGSESGPWHKLPESPEVEPANPSDWGRVGARGSAIRMPAAPSSAVRRRVRPRALEQGVGPEESSVSLMRMSRRRATTGRPFVAPPATASHRLQRVERHEPVGATPPLAFQIRRISALVASTSSKRPVASTRPSFISTI